MECSLKKYKIETATHWIGCTGNEYLKDEYINHGEGGIKTGKKDLPETEYPYTVKHKVELMFECCKVCNCENK